MLEISNVRAGYGVINVLWDISMSIPQGRLTTIIGPNGAGKTTLLRAIMGLIPLAQGSVAFNGLSLSATPTWGMLGQGVAMIPEGRMIFKDMSIEENLMLGAFPKASRAAAWVRNLERHNGAIAYDKAAFRAAKKDGITSATRDQWRRATTQAGPALRYVNGCR